MAGTDVFQEVGKKFTEKMFSGILIFGIIVVVVAVLGFLGWYFFVYKRKFDIIVRITSERAEERNKIVFDKAAILIGRKDGARYLRLWDLKIDLPIPKFNILQVSNKGDYLELYRTAEGTFYYLTPAEINKKYYIKADGKIIPMAGQISTSIDPEMEFWSVKRKRMNKGMFDTESPFMKLLVYLPYIIAMMVSIFVIYILMKYLPSVLTQLKELAETLAKSTHAAIVTGG